MRLIRITALSLILLPLSIILAVAQFSSLANLQLSSLANLQQTAQIPQECDIKLFKHIETQDVRKEDYVFFLDLVTRENYGEMKQSVNASWVGEYGFFKSGYDELDVMRTAYRKERQLQTQEKYSRDYAVSTLKHDGLEAYKACLNAFQPEQSIIVYRDANTYVDKLVTFVIRVNSKAELHKLVVNVYGAGKLLSDVNQDIHVKMEGDVTHIRMEQLSNEKQFTFKRGNPKTEFIVTAEIATTLRAIPLVICQVLEKQEKWVPAAVGSNGSFMYYSRVQENDRIYQIDGISHGPWPGTFYGSACLCASGKRTAATLDAAHAGFCDGIPDDVKMVTDSVKFSSPEASLSENYKCYDQDQVPVKLTRADTDGVCYTFRLSLNADVRPGKGCTISWDLRGTALRKEVVYVNK
jgi:hypothetical protein